VRRRPWRFALAEKDGEDLANLAEAEPHRRGRHRQPLPLVLAQNQRVLKSASEGRHLSFEAVDLFHQRSAAGAGELGLGDRLLDPLGVAVGSLSAAARLLGLLGDVAVSTEEDGGGIADPGEQR
jgi:hypothetical protein